METWGDWVIHVDAMFVDWFQSTSIWFAPCPTSDLPPQNSRLRKETRPIALRFVLCVVNAVGAAVASVITKPARKLRSWWRCWPSSHSANMQMICYVEPCLTPNLDTLILCYCTLRRAAERPFISAQAQVAWHSEDISLMKKTWLSKIRVTSHWRASTAGLAPKVAAQSNDANPEDCLLSHFVTLPSQCRLCGCVFALLQCNPNLQLLVWHMAKQLYVRISSGFFFCKGEGYAEGVSWASSSPSCCNSCAFCPAGEGESFHNCYRQETKSVYYKSNINLYKSKSYVYILKLDAYRYC